jgi:hypothetical protein
MANSKPNKRPNSLFIKAREFLAKAKEKEPKTTTQLSEIVGKDLQPKSKKALEKEETLLDQDEIRQELETRHADLFYGDLVEAKTMTESEAMPIVQQYYNSDQPKIDTLRILNSSKSRAEQIELIEQQTSLWKNFYLNNKN